MRILEKYWGILILLGLLMLYTNVYAADVLYRFMHNDHDALVIGEITSIDESGANVRVEKNIVSAKNLNEASPKRQLKLTEAKVALPFCYIGFYDEDGGCTVNPSVGDYVLLSLKKAGTGFKIAWGAYKVDSLNYKSLSVVLPESAQVSSKMNAAAVKAFVNSDGKITEFVFDCNTKTVYAGEERTVIFNGNTGGITDTSLNPTKKTTEDKNKTQAGSSIGVIGSSDGQGSVFISVNPIKALIIPIIVFAAVIFVGGFAIGYIVKSKRLK